MAGSRSLRRSFGIDPWMSPKKVLIMKTILILMALSLASFNAAAFFGFGMKSRIYCEVKSSSDYFDSYLEFKYDKENRGWLELGRHPGFSAAPTIEDNYIVMQEPQGHSAIEKYAAKQMPLTIAQKKYIYARSSHGVILIARELPNSGEKSRVFAMNCDGVSHLSRICTEDTVFKSYDYNTQCEASGDF